MGGALFPIFVFHGRLAHSDITPGDGGLVVCLVDDALRQAAVSVHCAPDPCNDEQRHAVELIIKLKASLGVRETNSICSAPVRWSLSGTNQVSRKCEPVLLRTAHMNTNETGWMDAGLQRTRASANCLVDQCAAASGNAAQHT